MNHFRGKASPRAFVWALNPISLGSEFVTTLFKSTGPLRHIINVCELAAACGIFCANRFVFLKCSQARVRTTVPVFLATAPPHPRCIPLTWDILSGTADKRDWLVSTSANDFSSRSLEGAAARKHAPSRYCFSLSHLLRAEANLNVWSI